MIVCRHVDDFVLEAMLQSRIRYDNNNNNNNNNNNDSNNNRNNNNNVY